MYHYNVSLLLFDLYKREPLASSPFAFAQALKPIMEIRSYLIIQIVYHYYLIDGDLLNLLECIQKEIMKKTPHQIIHELLLFCHLLI